jgi:hypothetical protein
VQATEVPAAAQKDNSREITLVGSIGFEGMAIVVRLEGPTQTA